MIVLDANILIRAVMGRRVRQLLEAYENHGIRFYAPDVAFADAEKYLPPLLAETSQSCALERTLSSLPCSQEHFAL